MAYAIYINGGIEPITTNPMIGPSAQTLDSLGANNAAQIKCVVNHSRAMCVCVCVCVCVCSA
jgi:hypothetical protein